MIMPLSAATGESASLLAVSLRNMSRITTPTIPPEIAAPLTIQPSKPRLEGKVRALVLLRRCPSESISLTRASVFWFDSRLNVKFAILPGQMANVSCLTLGVSM
jgi:hypothetical protein